ncbi:MAG: oxidoreductase [Paenibacillus sp.]|nr:oxidoreductase [Paenibacillus sp.]
MGDAWRIIGQGRSGRDIHTETLKKLGEQFIIAAVSDELEERRIRANNDYGCDTYSDYREMIKRTDLDLIVNATPSHLHVPVSLELLEAGFNVLCEKPLARTQEEVNILIEASKKAGKVLAVFHQYRFFPVIQEINKVLDSGVLGRIVQVSVSASNFSRRWDWQTLKSRNGGSLMNTGSHFVDLSLQWLGTETLPNVLCRMDSVNSFGDAEDYCKIILNSPGKPLFDIEISSANAYAGPTYLIQGKNGGLKASNGSIEYRYFKPEEAPHHELELAPLSNADGMPVYCREQLTWYEGSWKSGEGQAYPSPAAAFYNMLYETLTEGKPLKITPEHVRQQIAIIEEAFAQNPVFAPEAPAAAK